MTDTAILTADVIFARRDGLSTLLFAGDLGAVLGLRTLTVVRVPYGSVEELRSVRERVRRLRGEYGRQL